MDSNGNLLEEAKTAITEFFWSEYFFEPDEIFKDISYVPLAYTITGDGEHEIRATADLVRFELSTSLDGVVIRTDHYKDLREMIDCALDCLDFDSLIAVSDEEAAFVLNARTETRTYSHDYPDDTKLVYRDDGKKSSLCLTFNSEDPDMNRETMHYNGEGTIYELMTDLLSEITGYLDRADHSSFNEQQGIKDGIHSPDDYYGEFSRTALYAFEGLLKENTPDLEAGLAWTPIEEDKTELLYTSGIEDEKRGCIGHLRGDFGHDGDEFWVNWFPHQRDLNCTKFNLEIQTVMDRLREKKGLLHDRTSMSRLCRTGTPVNESYGFHAESHNYEYCLRCNPSRGDYNFYLYCYDKQAQRKYARENPSIKDQLKSPVPSKPTHKTDNKKEMER